MSESTAAPAAPALGSAEYDALMVARSRGTPDGSAPKTEAEALAASAQPDVPAKFLKDGKVDVDSLLASYRELEKRLSGGAGKVAEAPPATPGATPPAQAPDADQQTAQAAVTAAGLDWSTLMGRAAAGQPFAAEEYAALERVGMTRDVADGLAKVLVERSAAEQAEAETYAGGKEATAAMLAWAEKNLSAAERESYNQTLASPQWRMAVDSIRHRMGNALPTAGEPKLVAAGGRPGGTASGYRSQEEMKADMKNPLYSKDPAFREAVYAKMRAATWDLNPSR